MGNDRQIVLDYAYKKMRNAVNKKKEYHKRKINALINASKWNEINN